MDQKFKDAISNNKKTLLKLIWKHPSKAWKTILGKGADSLYTTMSHADDPKYKQLDQPLWLNFGYCNRYYGFYYYVVAVVPNLVACWAP